MTTDTSQTATASSSSTPSLTRMRLVQPGGSVEAGGAPVYETIARLMVDAYPVMGVTSADAFARYVERVAATANDDATAWVIAYRGGAVAGAMRLYDYTMNARGTDVLAGGVGSLAVGLAHKRQGVARAMVGWYLAHYRERGATFAVLHPFRTDFYRALGFGYGTPVHTYRIAPGTLRAEGARGTVRLLDERDVVAFLAASERIRATTSGLIRKHDPVTRRSLADIALRWIGVEDDGGTLRGFMQTSVALGPPGTLNTNELIVRDLQAEDDAYRAALLGYLRAQRDQFARVIVETQDDAFFLASDDPRDGSDRSVSPPVTHRVAETGLGMMYRIVDIERALALLPRFAAGIVLRLEVAGVFPAIAGSPAQTFVFGPSRAPYADAGAEPDATLRVGVADFSSLIAGSLRLHDLVRHRLATVTPNGALDRVAALLDAPQRPVCTTRF